MVLRDGGGKSQGQVATGPGLHGSGFGLRREFVLSRTASPRRPTPTLAPREDPLFGS